MFKDLALSLFCVVGALQMALAGAWAQSLPAPDDPQPVQAAQPALSQDDPRLLLMIRNAIIALNQANLTGNYSVLRDMGTPNFALTNSPARLAEAFATLRNRKIDISPIMFFIPKFSSPPAMLDSQVLRVSGLFPTTPEQVNFDLAFQLNGEQWMLAAIAVNVAPPGENPQASAAPASQPSRTADSGEKPIRIDLSQPSAPTPAQAQPAPPKKAAPKKPKPPTQQTAAARPAAPGASANPEQPAVQPPAQRERPAPSNTDGAAWNPFGR